ncbi:SH3 domain [Lasallia pustulata]|uniref:SH3 domain n=1 Tax=Lasallia pustulata TaxID=136370 RepID=A0A1W5D308_9LECA|nr:SH3 domain [Lasallia pustulata]
MPHHNHLLHLRGQRAGHEVNGVLNGRAPPDQVQQRDVVSVLSVVYVTAAPTFDGPIAGFTTLGPAIGHQTSSASAVSIASTSEGVLTSALPSSSTSPGQILKSQSTSVQIQTVPKSQSSISSSDVASTATSSSTSLASSSPVDAEQATPTGPSTSSSISLASSSSVVAEQATPTGPSTSSSLLAASATVSPNTNPTAVPESISHGMTNGAKAGLAIGIILGLGAFLVLGLVCYRRKKKQRNDAYHNAEDEKNPFGDHGAAFPAAPDPSLRSSKTASTAPRLSLRPVTQFLPEMSTGAIHGNALGLNSFGPNSNATQANDAVDNGVVQSQANDPANPFGNHAETSDHIPQAVPVLGSSLPTAEIPAPLSIRPSTLDLAASIGLVVGGVGAITAQHRNGPGPATPSAEGHATNAPPHPTEGAMPSPVGTEFSMNSISSSASATGPPPTNVHRIQLDFMPSMEDEIQLRAGQLVRLLHEYDDGWALCIRLDRSQQGVAPRTCLSTRPVKRRPAGNGRGPPGRGPLPPATYNRAPGPMSPGPFYGQRSMSPGPYGGGPQQRPNVPPLASRRRSNSASEVRERRHSPPGPSPMNPNASIIARLPPQLQPASPPRTPSLSPQQTLARKPVAGQAM